MVALWVILFVLYALGAPMVALAAVAAGWVLVYTSTKEANR